MRAYPPVCLLQLYHTTSLDCSPRLNVHLPAQVSSTCFHCCASEEFYWPGHVCVCSCGVGRTDDYSTTSSLLPAVLNSGVLITHYSTVPVQLPLLRYHTSTGTGQPVPSDRTNSRGTVPYCQTVRLSGVRSDGTTVGLPYCMLYVPPLLPSPICHGQPILNCLFVIISRDLRSGPGQPEINRNARVVGHILLYYVAIRNYASTRWKQNHQI